MDDIPQQNLELALMLIGNNNLRRKFLEWLESDKVNISTIESKTEDDAIHKLLSNDFKIDYVFIEASKFDIVRIINRLPKKPFFIIVLFDSKLMDAAKRDEILSTKSVEEMIEISSLNMKIIENFIINIRIKKSSKTKTKERYQFIKILGLGTSGQVDLMKDNEKDMLIAVKKIPLTLMDEDAKLKTEQEVDYLRRVKGPTIIEFYETKTLNDVRYIYLEYAEQGTLEEKIMERSNKGGEYSYETILEWICEIFISIFTLHQKKLIHRDMKCENILLTKDNIAKLSDLGISRLLIGNELAKTSVGTPYYISPEILREEEYSFNSDIWSLGVVLYELITLRKPFFKEKVQDLYDSIKSGEYKSLNENVDIRLKYLVSVMLRKSKTRRYNIEDLIRFDFIREKINSICQKFNWSNSLPPELFISDEKVIIPYINFNIFINQEEDLNDLLAAQQIQENCIYSTYKSGFFGKKIENAVEAENLFSIYNELNMENITKIDASTFLNRLIKKEIIIPLSHPNIEIVDAQGRFYIFSFENYDELIDNINITNTVKTTGINLIELSKFCLNEGLNIYKMQLVILSKSEATDQEIKSELTCNKSYFNFLTGISLLKRYSLSDFQEHERLVIILNVYQIMLIQFILKLVFHKYKKNNSLLGFFKSKAQITYMFKDFSLNNMEIKHILLRNNKKPPGHYLRLVSSSDPKTTILSGFNDFRVLFVAQDFPGDLSEINLDDPHYRFEIFDEKDVFCQLDEYVTKFCQEILYYEENVLQVPRSFEPYVREFGTYDIDFFLYLNKFFFFLNEGEKESDLIISIKYY